jgi:hypothetical protein
MNCGSRKQRSLYFSAPKVIKEAITTAYGMQQRRARYGKNFHEAMALLCDTEYRSNGELQEQQHQKAVVFIDQALKTTQYSLPSKIAGNSSRLTHTYPGAFYDWAKSA